MEEMNMEEQMVSFSNNDATHIAKGKRTKRLRLLSPCGLVAASVITSTSSSVSGGEEEEEDMANCLILLAQGGNKKQESDEYIGDDDGKKTEKGTTTCNRRFAEITSNTTAPKVGFYVYECKTCNRTFPSFQALGGHRASHKKPKIIAEEKKLSPPPPLPPSTPPQPPQLQSVTNCEEFKETGGPTISLQMVSHGQSQRAFSGNKSKIHECSICGSEFTSGQALGGHMRRHRTSPTNAAVAVVHDGGVRPRNILQLDLNLPAPEEDLRETKFQFMSASPALVDCHY